MSSRKEFDSMARNFLKETLLAKTNSHCAYCGKGVTSQTMHIEHVIPLSREGTNDIDNLVPACKSCNMTKGTMTLDRFRLVLWFKKKFALTQKFTPAQIFDLNELGFFDGIPEERNHSSFRFCYPPLNTMMETPF